MAKAAPGSQRPNDALSPDEKKIARQKKKSDAFKKLATKRVNKALGTLTAIAALSNRNSYAYDQDQVNKIFAALNGAMKAVADSFATPAAGGTSGFSL